MIRGRKPSANPANRARALRLKKKCKDTKRAGGRIMLSAITLSELEYGARGSADYKAEISMARRFAAPFEIVDYDGDKCAEFYGKIRHELKVAGTPIGVLDQLLAAHALALDATMVTNNTADFQRVKGLRVVNWS